MSCQGECDITSCDVLENLCLNKIDTKPGSFSLPDNPCQPLGGGILLEVFLFLYSMLGLAIVCDDYLCVALERLCEEFLIREDVAGATFMAFGSAAPEVILNTIGTIKQARSWPPSSEALESTNLGVGAILGSGMIAMLVIPGACALATDGGVKLLLKRRPLLRDLFAYTVSLALLCIFFSNGTIEIYEAAVMVTFYILYVITVFFSPSVRQWYRHRFLKKVPAKRKSFVKRKSKGGSQGLKSPLLAVEGVQDEGEDGDPSETNPMLENAGVDEGNPKGKSISTANILFQVIEDGGAAQEKKRIDGAVANDFEGSEEDEDLSVSVLGAGSTNENDAEKSIPRKILGFVCMPLNLLFQYTCIDCEKDSPYENWYPLTFLVSFLWVSGFSTIISSVAARWIAFSPPWANGTLFGLLCAVGAEIPDTIQSVTMARRGYGSMAVSNAIGSQVLNICIGLGLPWLFAAPSIPAGGHFEVTDHANLQIAAFFQFGCTLANFSVLLVVAVVQGQNKAKLNANKGYILLALYVLVVGSYVFVKLKRSSSHGCSDDDAG